MGKRHLEEAMLAFSEPGDFKVTWKPFFLSCDTPEAGVPLLVYLEKKAVLEGRNPLTQPRRAVVVFFSKEGSFH